MIRPTELIKLANEIDNRIGPIPGPMADRIAVLLRKIAESDTSHMALPAVPMMLSVPAIVPEPVTKAVERILDEHSAWIARPNKEVTDKIALACTVAAQRIIEELAAEDNSVSTKTAESFQSLAPTAPLPWDSHHSRPEVIVDAIGCEVCRVPGEDDEAIRIVGMILCAVNTCGRFKAVSSPSLAAPPTPAPDWRPA